MFFLNRRIDTSKEEKLIYECIQNKYNGVIPRYTLEGLLLYELNYSPFKMYQVVMNLTLNEKLFLISKSDGEYYSIKNIVE